MFRILGAMVIVKKKRILMFGAGLLAGISSSLKLKHSKHHNPVSSLPLFYAGTWQYYDPERDRSHRLTISPELKLGIDHREIPVTVQKIDNDSLIYLDQYGYHITIQANASQPVSLIDEADDQVYHIKPL